MRTPPITQALGLAALALAACGSSGGAAPYSSPDAAPDAGADAASDGAPATSDGPGAVFRSIDPCTSASDYVFSTHVQTVDSPPSYSPKCIKVPLNTTVILEANAMHPIVGTHLPGTDPGSAIPDTLGGTVNPVTATFTQPGFFSFECVEHTMLGMKGVVWVSPE
jgi:plastocyanin